VEKYQNPDTGEWFIDSQNAPKGKATKLAAKVGPRAVKAVRGIREKFLKPVGRAAVSTARALDEGSDSLLTMELGGIDLPL